MLLTNRLRQPLIPPAPRSQVRRRMDGSQAHGRRADHREATVRAPLDEGRLLRRLRADCTLGRVAAHQGRVLGFMLYELRRTSFEILNIGVHPSLHRQGIGTALLWRSRRA